MARVMAIDYGLKRTGIAVTDPLQIIATGLAMVESQKLFAFLRDYFSKEQVERLLVGEPKNLDDSDTHATPIVKKFVQQFKRHFPAIPVEMVDERYTSKMASQAMLDMGLKKKQRREKGLIDEISATILLQEWLQRKS